MSVDYMRKRYVAELFSRVVPGPRLAQGQPHPHLQGRGPGGAQVPLLRQQDQRARLQRYVEAQTSSSTCASILSAFLEMTWRRLCVVVQATWMT